MSGESQNILPVLFVAGVRGVADSGTVAAGFQRGLCAGVLRGGLFSRRDGVVAAAGGHGGHGHRPERFLLSRQSFRPELLLNYAIYAGLIALGKWLGKTAPFWKLLFGGILGAAIFYVLTNTLSWLMDPGYAKTIAGWIQALFTGLPGYPPSWEFFRNTLLSGGLFTALFAGAAKATEESPAEKTAGAAERKMRKRRMRR